MNVKWICSIKEKKWHERPDFETSSRQNNLELSGAKYQELKGLGGCFNELGWHALNFLKKNKQDEIIKELFHPEDGCRFTFCRLPIGASDFALKWYSCNETDEDYEMRNFSIERDRQYLIPYIRSAMEHQKNLTLFASPWSPPTWMKIPSVYNFGVLRWEEKILKAYALYFQKFVEAYQEEGIKINQIHHQNEPVADQKFPSCLWTGEQMRDFIKLYLGPLFEKSNIDCEIWLGTLNVDDYNEYILTVLSDEKAKKYIKGIGYQWWGKRIIQRTHETWTDMPLIQTENECGDGKNTYEYAHYIFDLMHHYFSNGVIAYTYWNMILPDEGESTWGWPQNSLININPHTKKITYNPEFYVMKHFSHFLSKGAVRMGLKGEWAGNALAFENNYKELVLIIANPFKTEKELVFKINDSSYSFVLDGSSFNTIICNA